jgi:hypothetical protein
MKAFNRTPKLISGHITNRLLNLLSQALTPRLELFFFCLFNFLQFRLFLILTHSL